MEKDKILKKLILIKFIQKMKNILLSLTF